MQNMYTSVFSLRFLKHLHYLFNEWCLKQKRFIEVKDKFKNYAIFDSSVVINKEASFEGLNRIGSYSYFNGTLGYGSYIGEHCSMYCHVGRFTSIAPYVHNNIGIHPIGVPFATTSPRFYSTQEALGGTFAESQLFEEFKEPTIIGNDCWIGEDVFIAGAINIGDGAVVLAGAVVVNDVPPYAIVGGVPAKIIKFRFDDETISFLLRIKWWDKPIEWLKSNYLLLCDIDKLKEEFNQ